MKFRVYEIIAAGAYENRIARFICRVSQYSRIKRFCLTKKLRCVEASVFFPNLEQELNTACDMYKMGFADAIVISGMEEWSEGERAYFENLTTIKQVKVIDLSKECYI